MCFSVQLFPLYPKCLIRLNYQYIDRTAYGLGSRLEANQINSSTNRKYTEINCILKSKILKWYII